MFETFDNYAFMFDTWKQPLKITSYVDGRIDESGYPIQGTEKSIDVVEPIINTQNPNYVPNNGEAGQYTSISTNWVSRHGEFNKGTKVLVKSTNIEYKVINKAEVLPKLFYYAIKKVDE